MLLVHELEQLDDDSLQEAPVLAEEARVLANDVHDVRGNDCLVVLATQCIAQGEQRTNDGDQEVLLLIRHWKRRKIN